MEGISNKIESESWKFFSSLLGNNYNLQRTIDLSRELMNLKVKPNYQVQDQKWNLQWKSPLILRLSESKNSFVLELNK